MEALWLGVGLNALVLVAAGGHVVCGSGALHLLALPSLLELERAGAFLADPPRPQQL